MAKLSIPPSEYDVLAKLSRINEAVLASLANALREISPHIEDLDLAKSLAEKVREIPPPDLKLFVRTLAGLTLIKEHKQRAFEAIVEDIKETILSEKPKAFPMENVDALAQNLTRLLGVSDGVALVAKAMTVVREQDSIYCGARVLSDLRPVFMKSPEEVSAAAIIHMLNISYHHDGGHKEFYVAMNPADLGKLKQVIERAEKKSSALKAYIRKSGIRYLEDTE
jgi:hypothetical protein